MEYPAMYLLIGVQKRKVNVVVPEGDVSLKSLAKQEIGFPRPHPAVASYLAGVPLQLQACHVAALRGSNVDHPRKLAKLVPL